MNQSPIDRILESRRPAVGAVDPAAASAAAAGGDKFSLILAGDRMEEHFLELRFRIGLRTCFAYSDLVFFNYDPDSGTLDLDFGGYLVTVKGRNLGERVLKQSSTSASSGSRRRIPKCRIIRATSCSSRKSPSPRPARRTKGKPPQPDAP